MRGPTRIIAIAASMRLRSDTIRANARFNRSSEAAAVAGSIPAGSAAIAATWASSRFAARASRITETAIRSIRINATTPANQSPSVGSENTKVPTYAAVSLLLLVSVFGSDFGSDFGSLLDSEAAAGRESLM